MIPEYIGQLEGELAVKASEADDFKAKNEELIAENKRLTDLTRLLLSSPAFSEFLTELSGTNGTSAIQDLTQPRSQPAPQPQQQKKDANPNSYRSRSMHNSTVGMAMIPEEPSYESNTGTPTGYNYTHTGMANGLYDAQVYAVTSLPEPDFPTFDPSTLSQKSYVDSSSFHAEPKDAPPAMPWLPTAVFHASPIALEPYDDVDCADIDESDPVFALYADQPATVSPAADKVAPLEEQLFGAIPMEKAPERIEMVTLTLDEVSGEEAEIMEGEREVDAATLERFYRLCASIEGDVARIESVMGRI